MNPMHRKHSRNIFAFVITLILFIKYFPADKSMEFQASKNPEARMIEIIQTPISAEEPEDYKNEKIQEVLIEKANVIDSCTVTWYTLGTCGKQAGDPTYGITASGLPVTEYLTCATDPSVIPMYSDVFVQYEDGTVEQLWATDTGVRGNHVDIYVSSYDEAIQNGHQILKVWFVPPDGGN